MKNLENYYSQLSKYTPCGSQTLSKMSSRYPANYPKALVQGKGGKVYDIHGHEYIDLISGLGAINVGYSNADVNDAVIEQLYKGTLFSLPSPIEYEAARRLTELIPGTEQWKFGKNGTDGTVMAVRAARAITGRTKIMTVGYNGCADVFECQGVRNAGIPASLKEDNRRATYNDVNSFWNLISEEYACVLLEPMVFAYPENQFLEGLIWWAHKHGALVIFDEVVNGGRFENYCSSSYFKVVPDIYVLGKGLANGFPLCAVGGKRSIMAVFERDDFFASGTFGGECVSLAAFMATSQVIQAKIKDMIQNGMRIQDTFNRLIWPDNTRCIGYPTRLNFTFPTNEHKFLFWQEMCKRGVLVGYSNFIKADNTIEELTKICEAMYGSYLVLKENWKEPKSKLQGKMPEEALKGRSN